MRPLSRSASESECVPMRKFIDRIIPRYAHLPLIMCGVTQFLAYFCTKYIHIRDYVDLALPIDHVIPVRPEWVSVYILSYVYWIVGYIAVSRVSRERCHRLCIADYIAMAISAVFFVLVPTTLPRDPVSGGLFAWALNIIYALDTPLNLFPSLHCLISWLLAREMMDIKQFHPAVRWGAFVFSFLVFASTVFTRQHFIIDIPAGVIVAEIARYTAHRLVRCVK